jgi:uncharacterized protein (TIGR03382 family)
MAPGKLILAVALASAATLAHADARWNFTIKGSGTAAGGGTEGCSPANPEQCTHAVDWLGTVTFITASAADGIYDVGHPIDTGWAPGGIVRVTMDSNLGGEDIDAQDTPGFNILPGNYPYAITIAGGHVTDIQWYSQQQPDGLGVFKVDGFAATFDSQYYHGPTVDVSGTLTAVPVPEPAPASLALLGLAAVFVGARRRGVAP